MRFDAYVPTRLVFGPGGLEGAGALARSLGRRALVVTSRSAMQRLGFTARLLASLEAAEVSATLFHDLDATPTTDNVDAAAEMARAANADCIVALGGGSALDCAKAAAGVAVQRIACAEYLHGRAAVTPNALPILAIPTTAGTGSEMNRSAIVTDLANCHKDAIRSDHLFPRIALVDPTLTHDLPAAITAQTGFDAFAHAIESYVSPKAQPVADSLALAAMEAVITALPRALVEPHNALAREQLAIASTTMGYNLSCVGTCLPHRLDKPLCARFPEIAHGQAIAYFYPAWAKQSWQGCRERFARIAHLLDPTTTAWDVAQAAAASADLLAGFLEKLGLEKKPGSLGIALDETMLRELASRVRGDLQINPVPLNAMEVVDFYRSALT